MLEYMLNDKRSTGSSTNKPIAIAFVTKWIERSFPNTFKEVAQSIGYHKNQQMNEIETAAVLSKVGVGDKKILNTSSCHLKAKMNGSNIVCKQRELALPVPRAALYELERYPKETL